MSILQQLRAGTELKTNLIDECSSSRSTVRRTLDQFEEYGWVNQRGGHCEALDESEQAIAAYSDLLEITQKVLNSISLLRRMGPEYADIPIEALGEAEHFVNSDSDREQLTKVTCSLSDLDVERIRGTVVVHTQMSADAFQDHFTGDTEIEIIIGTGVHREILRSQNILDFKDAIGSGKTKFSMRVHPEVESVGFGIFGTDLIIMGADKGHVHPAGIVCTDDRLIEWAEERFDRLYKESSPMLEHFRKTASNITTRANEIVHSLLDE